MSVPWTHVDLREPTVAVLSDVNFAWLCRVLLLNVQQRGKYGRNASTFFLEKFKTRKNICSAQRLAIPSIEIRWITGVVEPAGLRCRTGSRVLNKANKKIGVRFV